MRFRRSTGTLACAAMLVVLVTPLGVRAEEGVVPVGELERVPIEVSEILGPEFVPQDFVTRTVAGTLLPVPGAGQVWQVYPAA